MDGQPNSEGIGQRISAFLGTLRQYVGLSGSRKREPLNDPESLRTFLETRASLVAQTSLYGYLRTRAGSRYPDLFDDDNFVVSINIAKWQIWLDCLSDLSIYTGALVIQRSEIEEDHLALFMESLVESIIADAGWPHEAGMAFPEHAEGVLTRIRHCTWSTIEDGEDAFSRSPDSLVTWTPIIDELKQLDASIVRNSVRYRWQEIRREFRDLLDAESLVQKLPPAI